MFRTATLMFATASLLVFLSLSSCSQTSSRVINSECSPSCGNIQISSPFRLQGDPGHCGNKSYELSCEADGTNQSHHAILYLFSGKYYVEAINYNNYTIRLVDAGVHNTKDNYFSNPVYPLTVFNFSSYFITPLVMLSCKNPMNYSDLFVETAPCINNTSIHSSSDPSLSTVYSYFMHGLFNEYNPPDISTADLGLSCTITLMVLVSPPPTPTDEYIKSCQGIYKQLAYGFQLTWIDYQCRKNCGQNYDEWQQLECGLTTYNTNGVECRSWEEDESHGTLVIKIRSIIQKLVDAIRPLIFKPFHLDDLYPLYYNNGDNHQLVVYTGLFLMAKLSLGLPFITALLIYKWRRRHLSMYEKIEDFLQSNINLMPVRYSYSDIKKMANGFKDRLGGGGFGIVYKAKLRSGRLVAIKMLSESKTNGEDFINEVATIGRIHHVNVVRLIGFCADRSKRALVYDFMSNGSLEKHIFAQQGAISLSCEKIFEIAVGVARGIQYLHQGCDMRILHFDLKPHNILLDDNFTAKISDFGLARLYPLDNSIVSLTAARGTIGYMAPELFYKNIGGVSYKADVYSFGMLMLEMAGRRKNLNAAIDHSSEFSQMYFPTWVSDQLNQGKEIEVGDFTEDEMKIIKKMIIVALWCIQMKPVERPSMSKVVEMLEGDIESLQIPPKPFLYPQQIPEDNVEDSTEWSSKMTESTEINLISAAN
uniref:probable receptor-like protein kinase At1g67000 isoform X2 n=1 Tax=Fragaria vesca subsp. vesca TaxID=101020 RepID=UPI0005C8E1A7|nr:PREDICTED: probable receptor-like protein kinase At1g67000 isoform X2 [Fragaria vesca subsp. vesca]